MPAHGTFVEAEHRRNFLEVQSNEEAQFYNLGFLRVDCCEFVQDFMHVLDEIVIRAGDFDRIQRQGYLSGSMTAGLAAAGAIDQDAPHDFGRGAEKALAILVVLISLAGQSNPGLMHERRGLKSLAG